MAAPKGLRITPLEVSDRPDPRRLLYAVSDALETCELGEYMMALHGTEQAEAFIAHSPEHALQWICERTTKTAVHNVIRQIYDNIRTERTRTESERGSREGTPAGGLKRKRSSAQNHTLAANRALVEKMNLELVKTVASSQDWENAKAPAMVTAEEQKYRNFAQKLDGVGVNAVSQMISSAVAVGKMEVFRDWQAILAVWKRQNQYGKKLFETTANSGPDAQLCLLSQANSQQQPLASQQADEAGVTPHDALAFRYRYFDAQKTGVDGIADEMRHRWKMDMFYEEYERLEKVVRLQGRGTGARGRGYNTIAKEHLFALVYGPDLGRPPTKDQDPTLWNTFGQMLDWGKRWNMLKKRIGSVGIFGLLPRSLVQNDFVQKRLTQTRVGQWVDMLAECNSDVARLAKRVEPLFLACMEESQPPPEFAFLEDLDNLDVSRPLALLM